MVYLYSSSEYRFFLNILYAQQTPCEICTNFIISICKVHILSELQEPPQNVKTTEGGHAASSVLITHRYQAATHNIYLPWPLVRLEERLSLTLTEFQNGPKKRAGRR